MHTKNDVTLEGWVKSINERGYGFISVLNDDRDVFFHMNCLAPALQFDDQLEGRRVRFKILDTQRGPRAVYVQPAD